MKTFNSKSGSGKSFFLIILALLSVCPAAFSQDYTKEVIELWEKQNIPLNKKDIALTEKVDSTGRRISQISVPELYVYRKNDAKGNGPALLYIPGGGYSVVSLKSHGETTAKHFLEMGFSVVAVLKYRLPDPRIVNSPEKVPLCDAQKALALLNQNAGNWQIDKNKTAVMGSSAGGHLAASLANLTREVVAPGVKHEELKQAVSILLYPVISFNLPHRHEGSYKRLLQDKSGEQFLVDYYSMEKQVTENTPPAYLVHAADDQTVPDENSEIYAGSLRKHGIVHKYVRLEKGGHGFGLNHARTGIDWTVGLEEWLHKETHLFDNSQSEDLHPASGLKIIFKLDDLAVKDGVSNCLETFDFLKEKQIKASFGIIPGRCDSTALKTLNPYLQATNRRGEKLFEIWHHGLDHVRPEFFGTGYDYQKAHFEQADKMVLELLGIQMHSFGTPYNAGDSITNRVISENPEYKVFMFSSIVPANTNGIKYLKNRTNMENGTGNPEFSYFVENYNVNKKKYTDYMILQGHPNQWTADKIEQFEQIIDFLISENCEFVLPYEFYQCESID